MGIIDRYVTRETLRTGGLVLAGMGLAFILERTLRLVRDVNPSHLPLSLALEMLAWRVPEIVAIALPFALFAGMLLTIQRLARDRELDVLQGAGLSQHRLLRPLGLMAIAAAAALAFLLGWLTPVGRYESRVLMAEARVAAMDAPLPVGTFVQSAGRVVYFLPLARDQPDRHAIFVMEEEGHGRRTALTATASGVAMAPDRSQVYAHLGHGTRLSLPATAGRHPSLLEFQQATMPLTATPPRHLASRGTDPGEHTLPELIEDLRDKSRDAPVLASLNMRLARVLAILLLPFAALPLGLAFQPRRQWIAVPGGALLVLAVDQAFIFTEGVVRDGHGPVASIWAVPAALALALPLLQALARPGGARGRLWDCWP